MNGYLWIVYGVGAVVTWILLSIRAAKHDSDRSVPIIGSDIAGTALVTVAMGVTWPIVAVVWAIVQAIVLPGLPYIIAARYFKNRQ